MEVVNWELIKHPLNWVTVLLMVMIFGIALSLVLAFYGVTPATKKKGIGS
jgi:hypothetical protein